MTHHGDRPRNDALWMHRPGARLAVGPAPYTRPAPGEVVVRVRAVGLNIVDGLPGLGYRAVMPWVGFPTVIGGDVAGEVVEVGEGVTGPAVDARVVGPAFGLERSRNRAAEGAFQHYVVLLAAMVAPIPDALSFEQAAVLPIQLCTAATGLFQDDHLGLDLPGRTPAEQGATVLVWGGSTGVGSNAVQLARSAGYRVVATASPHNVDYLRALGAAEVVDRTSSRAVDDLVAAVGAGPLAGSLAIGHGSLRPVVRVAARVPGSGRVASAMPGPLTRLRALAAPRCVRVSGIWGGTLKDNEVGPAVVGDFLPAALASGAFRAAPPAEVVGHGLEAIPAGIERLKGGVSARKLVVTL